MGGYLSIFVRILTITSIFRAATFQKVNSDAVEKIRKISLCENLENETENDEEENDDDDVFDDIF